MKNFILLLQFINAFDYIVDGVNGILFQENDPIWVYESAIPVTVNILLDSPREKFRRAMKADCGENYLEETMEKNLFGRNDSDHQESTENCLMAFKTFDQVILSFLGQDLVTTEKYEKTNRIKRNKLFREKIEREQKEYEEHTKMLEAKYRSRRNAAVAGGLTVAGTLGYTIAADAKSRARDALLADEIDIERKRISMLEDVVETVNDKIDEAVKRIRKSQRPIISYGGLQIPDDAKAITEIMQGADQEINRYFAEQSASLGTEVIESILTLRNHRLPLNTVFLDAIKAHCIAYQKVSEDEAKEFCTNYSFHSSRWDTRLRFQGMGLTTWPRKDGKSLSKEDMEIKQVIIALQVEIPRMKLVAKKYSAINLGYFTEDNSRWMVEVPQHLVVMPSKEVMELRPSDCLIFTPTFACDAVSLAPSQCGESILLGNSTQYCEVREVDNRKCGYFEDNFRAFVSMREPSVASFFHHYPSEQVNKIDSIKKTPFPGVLNCGPAILRISAGIHQEKKTSMIHYISPLKVKMRSVQDEEMALMNSKIRKNLDTVKTMGNTILEMNMTTLELVRRTAITESKSAADAAKNYIFKNFITPIFGLLGVIFGLTLLYISAKFFKIARKQKKRRENSKTEMEIFCPPPPSCRSNDTIP